MLERINRTSPEAAKVPRLTNHSAPATNFDFALDVVARMETVNSSRVAPRLVYVQPINSPRRLRAVVSRSRPHFALLAAQRRYFSASNSPHGSNSFPAHACHIVYATPAVSCGSRASPRACPSFVPTPHPRPPETGDGCGLRLLSVAPPALN